MQTVRAQQVLLHELIRERGLASVVIGPLQFDNDCRELRSADVRHDEDIVPAAKLVLRLADAQRVQRLQRDWAPIPRKEVFKTTTNVSLELALVATRQGTSRLAVVQEFDVVSDCRADGISDDLVHEPPKVQLRADRAIGLFIQRSHDLFRSRDRRLRCELLQNRVHRAGRQQGGRPVRKPGIRSRDAGNSARGLF
jgi:hypothetical protein